VRVRNATHNFVYAETYGAQAMAAPLQGGGKGAKGVFRCIEGDFCQHELYDYG
jgi:hypothetical protein